MFKIEQTPLYWWPVHVYKPSADKPGEMELAGTFEAQFAWMDESEIDDFNAKVLTSGWNDRQAAAQLVRGWRGVAGSDGKEIAFSAEELKLFLAQPLMGTRVMRAFWRSRSEAAQKN